MKDERCLSGPRLVVRASDSTRQVRQPRGLPSRLNVSAGVPARVRRHGDPFPLPQPLLDAGPGAGGEQRSRHRRVCGAVHSLNALAAATTNSRRALGHDRAPQERLLPSTVQREMLHSINRRVGAFGERPLDLHGNSALRELLSVQDHRSRSI